VGKLICNLKNRDDQDILSGLYSDDKLSELYRRATNQEQELSDGEAIELLKPLINLTSDKEYYLEQIKQLTTEEQKISFFEEIEKYIMDDSNNYPLILKKSQNIFV